MLGHLQSHELVEEQCASVADPSTEVAHQARRMREAADIFLQQQACEEEVRAALLMLHPNRRERLLGWAEYRAAGPNFRATISWDPAVQDSSVAPDTRLLVPGMADVLEGILVGSLRDQDLLTAEEEFEIYRGIVSELQRRLNEMQSCYE